jgi:hypothetical protein
MTPQMTGPIVGMHG